VADITYESEGTVQKWIDGGYYQRIVQGSIVEERPFNADDLVWIALVQAADATGSGDFLTRVRTALNTDKTYLDKVQAGTATNADSIAQVAALTRQIQALIVYVVLRP
jgi:hypothetical protein